MKKSNWFSISKNLVYLTQFGLSVSMPIILTLFGAYWLTQRFNTGGWVYIVAIFLGLGASASAFYQFLKFFQRKNNQRK